MKEWTEPPYFTSCQSTPFERISCSNAARSAAETNGSSAPCRASTLPLMFFPSAGVGLSSPPWKETMATAFAPARPSSMAVVPPKQ